MTYSPGAVYVCRYVVAGVLTGGEPSPKSYVYVSPLDQAFSSRCAVIVIMFSRGPVGSLASNQSENGSWNSHAPRSWYPGFVPVLATRGSSTRVSQ